MRKKIISILLLAIVLSSCTQEKISKEDDVVDIVWYVLGNEQKDEKIVEDEINKRLEKEIGVRLDLRMIDANEYAEKMRFNLVSLALPSSSSSISSFPLVLIVIPMDSRSEECSEIRSLIWFF